MYAREHRVLRHYLEQGLSKAEIACTRYYRIDSGRPTAGWTKARCAPVRYALRPPMPCKIDRYREIIQSAIERVSEGQRYAAVR